MSWKVRREVLLDAVEVLELVPARLGVPSSEFFRIGNLGNGKTQWTVASDATGVQRIIGEGIWPVSSHPFYVNRKIFTPFVQAAHEIKNKNSFEFKLMGKSLVIRHGKRKAIFSTQPGIDGYGGMVSGNSMNRLELSEAARGLVYCARECASGDQLKPELHCVYLHPVEGLVDILASNQKIMFRARAKTGLNIKESVPMPLFLVTVLGARQLKAVEWKKGLVLLRFPYGEIWQSISSKALSFPRKGIVGHISTGAKKPVLFRVSTRRIATALERLGAYLQAVRKQDWVLELSAKKGDTELLLKTSIDHFAAEERVAVDGEVAEDFQLNWPLQMLIPVMEYVGQAHKKLWLEVRLWMALNKKGKRVLASYVKTGDVQLVIPPVKGR